MPVTDVQDFVRQYPQFEQYSPEAQQAAMDAYNGAMYRGEGDEQRAIELAHIAASRIDGSEAAGRSSETLPRRGQGPRVVGGEKPTPRGGVR